MRTTRSFNSIFLLWYSWNDRSNKNEMKTEYFPVIWIFALIENEWTWCATSHSHSYWRRCSPHRFNIFRTRNEANVWVENFRIGKTSTQIRITYNSATKAKAKHKTNGTSTLRHWQRNETMFRENVRETTSHRTNARTMEEKMHERERRRVKWKHKSRLICSFQPNDGLVY